MSQDMVGLGARTQCSIGCDGALLIPPQYEKKCADSVRLKATR